MNTNILLKLTFFILLFLIIFNCMELIKLNDQTEIAIFLGMIVITIILRNRGQNIMEFFLAPVNHKMGPYSGIKLNPGKLNERRKLIPSDPNMYKNFKNVKSNCGWMKQPCDAPLYGNVNFFDTTGKLHPLKSEDNDHLSSIDGVDKRKKMFMFTYNQCRPECCPSTYSCDKGCVCTTKQQRKFINTRGNNQTNPIYPYI